MKNFRLARRWAALALGLSLLGGCALPAGVASPGSSPSAPSPESQSPSANGGAVPEGERGAEDWFDDALLVGHSMMVGFEAFSGLEGVDCCALNGASVRQLLTCRDFSLPYGGQGSLEEVLQQRSYGKVYLMLGVNEITEDLEVARADYLELVDLVRTNQPESQIYVISVLPVTRSRDRGGVITTERVLAYNGMLLELCQGEGCWYLDLYAAFADEEGFLPDGDSSDGLHPRESLYPLMLDYLLCHRAEG